MNNPEATCEVLLQELQEHPKFRYVVFQLETGDNGTPHIQGYMEFTVSLRFNAVKNHIGGNPHLEKRRGTRVEARAYCMKEDSRTEGPFEAGEFAGSQGKRTDLEDACNTAVESMSLATVAAEHPATFVKFHRGFTRLIQLHQQSRELAPKVTLCYGPTGTGKTLYARSVDEDDFYVKPPSTKWFDGYTGQKTLILDDFAGKLSKFELTYVLQLLDRYSFQVEFKGGYCDLLAERIIITTNIHPRMWYDYSRREEHYKALARRIHEIWYFPVPHCIPLFINHVSFFETWSEGCDEINTFENVTRPNTPIPSDEEAESEDLGDTSEEADFFGPMFDDMEQDPYDLLCLLDLEL